MKRERAQEIGTTGWVKDRDVVMQGAFKSELLSVL